MAGRGAHPAGPRDGRPAAEHDGLGAGRPGWSRPSLVERRDQLVGDGIDWLRAEFGRLRREPVAQVAYQLLARLLPDRAEDDVALVAVRFDPQDRSG